MQKYLARISLAIVVPLVAILLAELGLRLAGVGYPTSFFRKGTGNHSGYWIGNPFYAYRFFDPLMARNPPPSRVKQTKEEGNVRVFVFGESAAMGDPVIEFSLSRALGKLLNKPGEPERFEVINAAITAIGSAVVADIAEEVASLEPDVFVIYMGNNEAVGPYGPGTVITKKSWGTFLTPLRVKLTRLRLVGILHHLKLRILQPKGVSEKTWGGMEMFGRNILAIDDPGLPPMYRLFERNLQRTIEVGRKAGARIVLCTVAVNIDAHAPFGSRNRQDLSDTSHQAWNDLYFRGISEQGANHPQIAEQSFRAALEIDNQHAELAYRLADVTAEQGRRQEARALKERARDLDVQRFRTDSNLNHIIRDTAEQAGVTLVDAEKLFALEGADQKLFVDHVHFSLEGLQLLSRSIALPIGDWYGVHELPDAMELMARLLATPWGERKQATVMLERRERPPFTGQLDNNEWNDLPP